MAISVNRNIRRALQYLPVFLQRRRRQHVPGQGRNASSTQRPNQSPRFQTADDLRVGTELSTTCAGDGEASTCPPAGPREDSPRYEKRHHSAVEHDGVGSKPQDRDGEVHAEASEDTPLCVANEAKPTSAVAEEARHRQETVDMILAVQPATWTATELMVATAEVSYPYQTPPHCYYLELNNSASFC